MPVEPYKRPPAQPVVAVLLNERRALDEHGNTIELEHLPAGVRVWASFDTARELLLAGHGEALAWNGEEIRWRHQRHPGEPAWKQRPTDVAIVKLDLGDDPRRAVRALARWRDWLAAYGAVPTGTTGSAAWSLLRATLEEPLFTRLGDPPPLKQTLGGRQELGPAGAGRYQGELEQADLPAAYAHELGHLPYGGRWVRASVVKPDRVADPDWWARDNRPVFVHATVRIPSNLDYGPLPRRPRKRLGPLAAVLLTIDYPVGRRIAGVWTWQELEQAVALGCRLQRVHETWAHLAGGRQPFLPWWDAVEAGRGMPGLAGSLAKVTGNALFGRFAMEPGLGVRTVLYLNRGRLEQRPLLLRPGLPGDHPLAETVTGRTRARLLELMTLAGPRLLAAHTDGAWTYRLEELPDGWQVKTRARELELLDPQRLRYTTRRGEPRVVYAGTPSRQAARAFENAWKEHTTSSSSPPSPTKGTEP